LPFVFCFGEEKMLRLLGGEIQQGSLNQVTGYSEKAQRTGKPSYLEPNSNSLQKPIEGLRETVFGNYLKRGYKTKIAHQFRQLHPNPEPSSKTPFKTLIPHDTTLILARTTSKTVQQHRKSHQKTRCNSTSTRMRSEAVN